LLELCGVFDLILLGEGENDFYFPDPSMLHQSYFDGVGQLGLFDVFSFSK